MKYKAAVVSTPDILLATCKALSFPDERMRNHPMAPNAPTIESYRSRSELHLLVPLAEGQDDQAATVPE